MKKTLFVLVFVLSALPALAQHQGSCQVVLMDRYNRILDRFYSRTDYRTGRCREGMRDCNYEMRRRGIYGARCVQVRGNGW